MFCPNCGKKNLNNQKYCRTCGLELEGILHALVKQTPEKANADLQRRKELFDKLGLISLSSFALLGFSYFFYKVIYYKLILFGANILEAFALTFLFVFGLLTVFFFNYQKLFGKISENVGFRENVNELISKDQTKMLEEQFIEPLPSITENSTEILYTENKTQKLQ